MKEISPNTLPNSSTSTILVIRVLATEVGTKKSTGKINAIHNNQELLMVTVPTIKVKIPQNKKANAACKGSGIQYANPGAIDTAPIAAAAIYDAFHSANSWSVQFSLYLM